MIPHANQPTLDPTTPAAPPNEQGTETVDSPHREPVQGQGGAITVVKFAPAPITPAQRLALGSCEPMTIGRFGIRQKLGEGAFGVVYRAYDPALKREVALKAGKRTASAEYLERFQREARNASHLQHPNIVAIFDSGCDGDEHYIACSLVHGRPLDRVLKAGMLPMREVVLIVRDIKRWDAETGQANLSITDRTNGVSCVACSADGKRIASGSADHTIKTWNAEVPAKKKP